MRGSLRFALALLFAGGTIVGCRAAFDGTTYRGDGFAFRVPERPASWRAIPAEGTSLAFRDSEAGATIAVNGRCGKDADDIPLAALTQHLFFQFTERDYPLQEVVPF